MSRSSPSFRRMATQVASTKRSTVTVASGLRAAPATYLTGLHIMPLMPLDASIALRTGVDAPQEKLQTLVEGNPDVHEGDYLVVGSRDYPIASVADWPWPIAGGDTYRLLIVEDIKR